MPCRTGKYEEHRIKTIKKKKGLETIKKHPIPSGPHSLLDAEGAPPADTASSPRTELHSATTAETLQDQALVSASQCPACVLYIELNFKNSINRTKVQNIGKNRILEILPMPFL